MSEVALKIATDFGILLADFVFTFACGVLLAIPMFCLLWLATRGIK